MVNMAQKKILSNKHIIDEISDESEILAPSKTQLKKQMLELQELGKKVAELSDKQREKIPLDDNLIEGIETYRRIKSNEGKRRQMQYIGKIMRSIDISPISDAIIEIENGQKKVTKKFHELEMLRDEFITQGDAMLPALVERFPSLNRQHLRQLLREAKKEIAENKAPSNQKKIFKYFRELSQI